RLLATVIKIANLFTANHEFGAFTQPRACNDRAVRRSRRQFEFVLPGIPNFQLVIGWLTFHDLPDESSFLRRAQLARGVDSFVEIVSGAKAYGPARCNADRRVEALLD